MSKVQTRNGDLEDFDRNKVINGLIKAGATAVEAEQVAVEVEAWLPTAANEGVVDSLGIRHKAAEVLKTFSPDVATSYDAYRKQ